MTRKSLFAFLVTAAMLFCVSTNAYAQNTSPRVRMGNEPHKYYIKQEEIISSDVIGIDTLDRNAYVRFLTLGENKYATQIELFSFTVIGDKIPAYFQFKVVKSAVEWRRELPDWVSAVYDRQAKDRNPFMTAMIVEHKTGQMILAVRPGRLESVPFCDDSNATGCSFTAVFQFLADQTRSRGWVQFAR